MFFDSINNQTQKLAASSGNSNYTSERVRMTIPKTGVFIWYVHPNHHFRHGHIAFQVNKEVIGFYKNGNIVPQSFESLATEQLAGVMFAVDFQSKRGFLRWFKYEHIAAFKYGQAIISLPIASIYRINLTAIQNADFEQCWKKIQEKEPQYNLETKNCVHLTDELFSKSNILPPHQGVFHPRDYREAILETGVSSSTSPITERIDIGVPQDLENTFHWQIINRVEMLSVFA